MAGMSPRTNACVLFSGGGSGGHVFPGLAVAADLAERGWQVRWAGSENGMEARLVPERDIEFHSLPSRPILGQGVFGKARAAVTLGFSALAGRRLVRRLDPRVVVGTGGYASVPAVVGAHLASRPVVLLEPNASPGAANRLLSRWAAGAAVAWEESARHLHCTSWKTGVPVRQEFFEVDTTLPDGPPRVLVLGGSQGARQLNEILPKALTALDVEGLRVTHQAGAKNADATRDAYGGWNNVEVVPFIDDVAGAMRRSHLVVSRAGAITLAELCAAGRPSLLVPFSIAAGHQVENARRMADAGAAEMIAPEDQDAATFSAALTRLLGDRERLVAMSRAARALAAPDAAAAIADRVEEVADV